MSDDNNNFNTKLAQKIPTTTATTIIQIPIQLSNKNKTKTERQTKKAPW